MEKSTIKNFHEKIYLQVDPEGEKPEGDYFDSEEVTWCEDRINETDLEYWSREKVEQVLNEVKRIGVNMTVSKMYIRDLEKFIEEQLAI
jgi:hypothetical protein